jgi:hypothetical protein
MERDSRARQATEKDYEELYLNRLELKSDMQRVLGCFSTAEKRQLVNEWKQKYSERKVEELIRFAKNKKVCYAIAHWDVEHFKRTRK